MTGKFKLVPKEVPERTRTSGYKKSIDDFLASDEQSCVINLEDSKLSAVYSGFHRILKSTDYTNKVALSRVDGELYIERL